LNQSDTHQRTRLAPSPTGALHLGNARTFLVNWALARQRGWRIVLRIDDLDGPRIKAGAADDALEMLSWLGLDWDEGPYFQRHDLLPYRHALEQMGNQGDIYPCRCTRKQITAASLSAPHACDHELRYPGTCRPAIAEGVQFEAHTGNGERPSQDHNEPAGWRIHVPEGVTTFADSFSGFQQHDVQKTVGDFLVSAKSGLPSYQLAVVVDDSRQGINQIVRGDDLLRSTARQLLLYECLNLGPVPSYTHLPLVVGEDGRRLAKRHGDSRLAAYRQQGVAPERIIGLLAHWCGLEPRKPMTLAEFLSRFQLEHLPHEQVQWTRAQDAWLLGQ
jgi:glutamyl-tRNA synthetase